MDWQSFIPELALREQQIRALDQTWEAFETGTDVVALQAPTGVGKSVIQLALARAFRAEKNGTSFIVTPQRALQDQMASWADSRVMKGRGSYDCVIADTKASTAPCTLSQNVRETRKECAVGSCPFFTAIDLAQKSHIVVHNYASLMAQSYISGYFEARHFLSLDEAHSAASWVRNFMSFEFTREEVAELTTKHPPGLEEFAPWITSLVDGMEEIPRGLTDGLKLNLLRMKACRSSISAVPWATVWNDYQEKWSIAPVKVAPIAWILTGLGQKVLLTSATVLHYRLLQAELGLGKKEMKYIDINSPFPKENRPIIRRYVGAMSYKTRERTTQKMFGVIEDILGSHPDEPGLIHTVSHALGRQIYEYLKEAFPARVIELLPAGGERDKFIRHFLSGAMGPSAVLIGASMAEGLDGKDDSCRWQIMCKAPYPAMNDPVVKQMMSLTGEQLKISQAWYAWKTAQQTVQTFGRVVRTPTDHGVTYLLDSSFQRVLESGFIPGYIIDAVR